MKIDYAQIIETANQRKDSLLKLNGALAQLRDKHPLFIEVLAAAAEVKRAFGQVDAEGRCLIPTELLTQIANFCGDGCSRLDLARRYGSFGYEPLLAALEAHED